MHWSSPLYNNKLTLFVDFFKLDSFRGVVALSVPFFDASSVHSLALVSKGVNQEVATLRFYPFFEKSRKENLYRNVMRGLYYYHDITNPIFVTYYREKILRLKYYQVISLIDDWVILSQWQQRGMIKSLMFALRLFYKEKPLHFFPAIILASSLSPGKFWETWAKYTEYKIFLKYPFFDEEEKTVKELLVKFYMQRGLDGLPYDDTRDLLQLILGARRFSVNLSDEEESFGESMDGLGEFGGHWNSLGYILHAYARDPLCHLPLDCHQFQDCLHMTPRHIMEPDTELYNMEDGFFHGFNQKLEPVYNSFGNVYKYE